jgi:hypothetical protein
MSTEFYRVGFSRFFTETFDDYRDVENVMAYFTGKGDAFTVYRSDDGTEWREMTQTYAYRAPGRVSGH